MKRPFNPYAYIIVISIIGIVGIFATKGAQGMRTATRDGVAMDTLVRLTVNAPKSSASQGDLDALLDEAINLIDALDKKISMYDPDSDLSRLNSSPAGKPVSVDRDLFWALESAREMAEITDGAYDPTIGAVTALWRDGRGGFKVPSERELARVLPLVGHANLKLSAQGEATLAKKGVRIDLGGIGKGFASQAVAELFRSRGIRSALIDLGGNVVVVGGRADGKPWRIGIQDPAKARGTPLVAIEVYNSSVITAGVYERKWEAGGTEYTHIFDPATGVPISGDLESVTVVTDDPTAGDALSTAFMVMGAASALDLLRILPGVEAVFVSKKNGADADREILATSGLRDSLELSDGGCSLVFADVY